MTDQPEAILDGRTICQVAIVVRDVEKTAGLYARIFGVDIPSVRLTAGPETSNTRYAGESTDARARLAFFDLGNITLELIEPAGAPSTWHEFLRDHGEGVHHIGFRVESTAETAAALEPYGIACVQQGDFKGGDYKYLDSTGPLGVMLELLYSKA